VERGSAKDTTENETDEGRSVKDQVSFTNCRGLLFKVQTCPMQAGVAGHFQGAVCHSQRKLAGAQEQRQRSFSLATFLDQACDW
jgi:hypothetical protein